MKSLQHFVQEGREAMAASRTRTQEFSVVGLQYRCTKPQIEHWRLDLPLNASVKREPENREDKNAIAVYVDDRKAREKRMKIGYLPRQVAEVFAASMDSGYVQLVDGRLLDLDSSTGTGTIEVKVKKRIHRG